MHKVGTHVKPIETKLEKHTCYALANILGGIGGVDFAGASIGTRIRHANISAIAKIAHKSGLAHAFVAAVSVLA